MTLINNAINDKLLEFVDMDMHIFFLRFYSEIDSMKTQEIEEVENSFREASIERYQSFSLL